MKRLNSLPERFLRNLTHEFNNSPLRKQFDLFKAPKKFKDFGELNLPSFYGFNTFETKTEEYELPVWMMKGLNRLGLVDLTDEKSGLIRQLSETFNEPKFIEVLEYRKGFKFVIDGNIYDSSDLSNEK